MALALTLLASRQDFIACNDRVANGLAKLGRVRRPDVGWQFVETYREFGYMELDNTFKA